ncbi:1-deoxy-D-xylulose 5-phosphate reductoisomerase [Actinomycetota bacterium]|nr:1-deoxy-D-xylulose 5-phosphate reductoisomerase [Actinomycetota bacterium]
MRDVVILGSTGSIGVQVLEVIASNPQLFRVVAISSAGSNPELVIAQAKQFKVSHVGVVNNAEVVSKALPGITVIDGAKASTEIAAINCDVVVNAIQVQLVLAQPLQP